MKYWTLFFSLILAVAAASVEYLYKDDPDAKSVIDHTAKTSFEASTKARLVEFYSPVSSHFQRRECSSNYYYYEDESEPLCNRNSRMNPYTNHKSSFPSFWSAPTVLRVRYI
jgi:hypothetical protein